MYRSEEHSFLFQMQIYFKQHKQEKITWVIKEKEMLYSVKYQLEK